MAFENVKNRPVRNMLVKLLAHIVLGTNSPFGFAVAPNDKVQKLAAAEPTFVLINTEAGVNDKGEVQVKATAAGIAASAAQAAVPVATRTVSTPDVPVGGFQIESNIPLPVSQRGTKVEIYPFSQLQPGQSFFVPATANSPDPAKKLVGTVASANRRFATKTAETKQSTKTGKTIPVYVNTRTFVVRTVTADSNNGVAGARVFRTDKG